MSPATRPSRESEAISSPTRALVVGADGFVGRWLVRHLREHGDPIHAIVGPRYADDLEHVDAVHRSDVRDYDEVVAALAASRPEAVYYLAAVSEAQSRERVEDAARIGLVGAIHVLTACAALGGGQRLVYVSSGHVYGGGDEPLTEDAPVEPTSIYGAVKAAAERALLALGPTTGVEVVVARPFNHIGPGQAAGFVVPALAERIRAATRASDARMTIGNREVVRDFTDVRDVVAAYRLLATRGEPGATYNVASGAGVSVEQVARTMAQLAGIEAEFETDPALVRGSERPVMIGDPSRLEQLGWRRSHSLEHTLAEVVGPTY